jgi:ribonuclease HI
VRTTVYTDGACLGNPGPGGWAWAVPEGPYASGFAAHTTNQRMEITAAYEAVRAIAGPLEVRSDSTYVVNCFRQGWWKGWLQRDWRNAKKEPVANRDLWEPFVELVRGRGDVEFSWVKGHSGDLMNDAVDLLATRAAATQEAESGAVVDPAALALRGRGGTITRGTATTHEAEATAGSGTRVTAATARPGAGGAPVAGHGVAVSGHRPPELGGYDENPTAAAVRRHLGEILAAKATLAPDLVVLTGLGLGAEQLAAEAAVDAGLPYVAVLPFPDPDAVWPAGSRERFRTLLAGARDVVVLQRDAPKTKQLAGQAAARRDAWLARHAAEAIVVWNREEPWLARLVRSYQDHLGDDVWILDPAEL